MSTFFDTNILLYAENDDDGRKCTVARELLADALETGQGVLSTQVLQEYFVNACKKLKLDAATARQGVERYSQFRIVTLDTALVLAAIDLHRLDRISLWDALVVRAAQKAGCSVLYSEDLQHGRRFDGVSVVDPFR